MSGDGAVRRGVDGRVAARLVADEHLHEGVAGPWVSMRWTRETGLYVELLSDDDVADWAVLVEPPAVAVEHVCAPLGPPLRGRSYDCPECGTGWAVMLDPVTNREFRWWRLRGPR